MKKQYKIPLIFFIITSFCFLMILFYQQKNNIINSNSVVLQAAATCDTNADCETGHCTDGFCSDCLKEGDPCNDNGECCNSNCSGSNDGGQGGLCGATADEGYAFNYVEGASIGFATSLLFKKIAQILIRKFPGLSDVISNISGYSKEDLEESKEGVEENAEQKVVLNDEEDQSGIWKNGEQANENKLAREGDFEAGDGTIDADFEAIYQAAIADPTIVETIEEVIDEAIEVGEIVTETLESFGVAVEPAEIIGEFFTFGDLTFEVA